MSEDDELYSRFLEGDTPALDTLMLRYRWPVMAYLMAMVHNEYDAEDLTMETFANILAKKPFIREGNFRSYLYRAARNMALNHIKRFEKMSFMPSEEMDFEDPSNTESTVIGEDVRRKLYVCLNRMEGNVREALWLFYFQNLSYAQIGEVMRMTPKKVDNLLLKGRKQLKAELEKEGITDAFG